MEQKKIDEITSIRYVGIEPSFKLYYNMVLCALGFFGLHHLAIKDVVPFAIQFFLLWLLGGMLFLLFPLGLCLGLCVFVVWLVPVFLAFYHYTDDDYFEAIKNKKTWPFINRMLLIVPKTNDKN
jgi:hypothetical protein